MQFDNYPVREPWLLEPARRVTRGGRVMRLHDAEVVDTFAEAFPMWGARIVVTAETPGWAEHAARSLTGFATSVIGCKCEAGIERVLDAGGDARRAPGRRRAAVRARPRRASASGSSSASARPCSPARPPRASTASTREDEVDVGGQLRYFGDGWQASKVLDGRRYWRIPVMEGEFLVEERFGIVEGVGGGNMIILAEDVASGAAARPRRRSTAMRAVEGAILPFPGGIARSGSKVGSRYKALMASTNHVAVPDAARAGRRQRRCRTASGRCSRS